MLAKEIDWKELLKQLAQNSQSERARELLRSISALGSVALANQGAQNVIMAQAVLTESALPSFLNLDSLPRLFEHLRIKSVLGIKDLMIIRNFLISSGQLKNILGTVKNPWSILFGAKISDFKIPLTMLNKAISPDGDINEDATPTLASLFEEKKKLTRDVAHVLDLVISRRKMENLLQDRYVTTREGRLVLPIKSGSQHDVKGLIHDRSFTKQTVFMEPEEALPINNRLRDLQLFIAEEIEKILRELSHSLARQIVSLENAESSMLECDITFAKAKMNTLLRGSAAKLTEVNATDASSENSSLRVILKEAKNPLLVLQGLDVVPNTIELESKKRLLLLSGPNAGGKTVLLKTLGLCAQMARCGLPIPALAGSVLPFFKTIDAVVGDLQSVEENLSSFSSHMKRLNETLDYKGEQTLVLVDEICGATDPEEGSALARSFINHYLEMNIFAVITSHLSPLKENWPKDSGLLHGSLEFDVKNNRPTYQLVLGIPGQSLALSVARRLGVPPEILRKAEEYLTPLSKQRAINLQESEDLRSQIIELKQAAQRDRDEAQNLKTQYAELVRKFREQRDRWLEKAIQKAEKKIENLIEDARQNRLKNKTIQDIRSELPTIIKAQPAAHRAQTVEEFRLLFKPGTPAFCSRLNRQILIQSEADDRGQVFVLADSMRVQVPWHSISALSASADKESKSSVSKDSYTANYIANKASSRNAQSFSPKGFSESSATNGSYASGSSDIGSANGGTTSSVLGDNFPELDLRGKRSDEAIDLLEKWLDDCTGDGQEKLKIIHGFGTEQLKKSVRQYLSKSRYVAKWSAGGSGTGGDGITWVILAD